MAKGKSSPSVSKETKKLQQLQTEQTQKALEDRKKAEKMQEEDQMMSARRAQMGLLSNILSSGRNQKLGG